MVWDFCDVNSFSSSTGCFADNPIWIAEVLESTKFDFLSKSINNSAYQHDVTNPLTKSGGIVVSTDPPYYDNIGYADLSDFFYVWMRRNLREIYPDIFSTMLTPKDPELIAAPHRFGGNRDAANLHFEDGLRQAFSNIRQITHTDYPVSVYYAFKQSESEDDEDDGIEQVVSSTGWETMLEGLIQAGFTIDGTWPMRTELGNRVRNLGSNALASSIVLVCRPRPENASSASRRQFIDALRREMPTALRELQSGNIAPVDLAQASIGPGMAIYSRYSKVTEASGTPMTVRTALQIINQELDTFLAEQEGDIDADSRLAVAWFEQFGFNEGEFGQADVLARAKNTSVEGVQRAEIVEAGRGKVRLLHHKELDLGWEPSEDSRLTVWETVNHLIARLNHRGESGAAALLVKLPGDLGTQARELAYRLYNICERKGWADHAYDYNSLVISWPAIQEEANKLRQSERQAKQQTLFGEE
jgi:putative DNA methylase